jgi:hypothetical protein
MSDGPQSPSLESATTTIDIDLPCFVCRYNLRTLTTDGTCPECGNPIEKSFVQSWLGFADQRWLRRVRFGATIIAFTVLAALVGGLAVKACLTYRIFALSPNAYVELGISCIPLAVAVGFSLAWLTGVWLLTTAELGPDNQRHHSAAGLLLLFLSIGQACAVIVISVPFIAYPDIATSHITLLSDPRSGFRGTMFDRTFLVATTLGGVIFGICLFLVIFHARKTVRRWRATQLPRLLTTLIWTAIALSLLSLGATLAWFNGIQRPLVASLMAGPGFLITGVSAASLLCLAWVLAAVVALFWFRRILTRAIEESTNNSALIAAVRTCA